jgi:DNA-directed RNA polymerase specialized sigma24 family protein
LVLDEDPAKQQSAIAHLIAIYRPFVVAVVARHIRAFDRAEDIAHDFIESTMLSGRIFKSWIRKPNGRFRYYLRTSIRNFCNTTLKKSTREPTSELWADQTSLVDANLPSEFESDEDIVWARSLFTQTLVEMKAECENKDQLEIWRQFFERVLSPLFLDVKSPTQSAERNERQKNINLLMTARRKFQRIFKSVVQRSEIVGPRVGESDLFDLMCRSPVDPKLVTLLTQGQFYDDEINRIFMSSSVYPENINLHAIRLIESEDQRRWIDLLDRPPESIIDSNAKEDDSSSHFLRTTIGELLFEAPLPKHVEPLEKLRRTARNLATEGTTPAQRLSYFVLYTHLICKLIVSADSRSTRLNTYQLKHNIDQCLQLDWLASDSHDLLRAALQSIE